MKSYNSNHGAWHETEGKSNSTVYPYLSPHGIEQLELGPAGVLPLVGEQDRRATHAEEGVLLSKA